MSIVRYEPWGLLNRLHQDLDSLFGDRFGRAGEEDSPVSASDWVPAVDIQELADKYVIQADVPGVDPNDIEVHMENGVLSIKGERQTETKNEDEGRGYRRVERVHGSFFRRFSLPDTADAERISARSANGVLEISIPKHAEVQPKRIQVER